MIGVYVAKKVMLFSRPSLQDTRVRILTVQRL